MDGNRVQKPHERLAAFLAEGMEAVNTLIQDRMASEHAPRIPEVTAHLVEAGGKRIRPMMTLAAHGIATAIRAADLILKATPMVIRFPKSCWTNGIGKSVFPPSLKIYAT